eukprot:3339284-Amphidinium_carterae.1
MPSGLKQCGNPPSNGRRQTHTACNSEKLASRLESTLLGHWLARIRVEAASVKSQMWNSA